MAEIIQIPLPTGFTKIQAFEMLANVSDYQPKLEIRTPKNKTFQKNKTNNPKELSEAFIATMDGAVLAYQSVFKQADESYIVAYIEISEVDNPESKVDFGKKMFGNICKNLFSETVLHSAKKELIEQAEQAGKIATESISFEGLEIL